MVQLGDAALGSPITTTLYMLLAPTIGASALPPRDTGVESGNPWLVVGQLRRTAVLIGSQRAGQSQARQTEQDAQWTPRARDCRLLRHHHLLDAVPPYRRTAVR